MINLSKTLFPFSFYPFPLRTEDYKSGDWNKSGPCRALPGIKISPCPSFLFVEKRIWSPRPSSGIQWADSAVNDENNRVKGLLVPPERIQITIWCNFLVVLQKLKCRTEEDGDYMMTTNFKTGWNRKVEDWDSQNITLLSDHQQVRRSTSWSDILWPSPLILSLKTLLA